MSDEKSSGSGAFWFWAIVIGVVVLGAIAGKDDKSNSGGTGGYDMEAHKRRAHEMIDGDTHKSERHRQMSHELVDQMIDPNSDLNRNGR